MKFLKLALVAINLVLSTSANSAFITEVLL